MRDYAYYNGVITPYDTAVIPLYDRSIFFAEAVYDVIIGRNGIPYQYDIHFSRLMRNAESIGLENLPTKEEVSDAIDSLLEVSEADKFILYIQFSGRSERRTHSRSQGGVNVLITVTKADIPTELTFLDAITLPDLRHGYCNLKTTNLLPAVFSICDAEMMECDIAIFQKDSLVTEASSANVSIIKDGVLITHPLDTSILPGISEINLIYAAEKISLKHIRREFTVAEMMGADAVLLTSTTKLVKCCRTIDGKELSCKIQDAVEAIFDTMLRDLLTKTALSEKN